MAFNLWGRTEILQSNGAVVNLMDVEILDNERVVGGASVGNGESYNLGYITNGHITDSTVDFDIQWARARGHYHGQLDAGRNLSGNTFNVNNHSEQATWVSSRRF